ncbi:putative HNHc nuclease [Lacrimispora sp.]|uniref:putative HNHc nuclease n=1 Tax=Lacrimispora sp. TaxID=2719234 RepID=UPI00289C5E3A|nr:putative HNHc nuclease [Lacrimispora sp.]
MHELAKIIGYKPVQEGTYLQIFIPGKNLMEPIEEKRMRNCMVWLDDGRHISAEQRKKAYATINDIAAYTGEVPEVMKEWLKYLYIYRTGAEYFSFSECSMDTAREFINVILDYALEMGIPLMDFALDRTDDIGHYLYACLKLKKCAICGRPGEIHHVDAIGMGNDRRTLDDSQHRKICLCRIHHTEAHTTGVESFTNKYKVYGIKYAE